MSETIDKIHFQLATTTLEAMFGILGVFAGNHVFVEGEPTIEACWEWYEKEIFNEGRLYEALGKDDARTVIGIFRNLKEVCQLVRKYKNWEGLPK